MGTSPVTRGNWGKKEMNVGKVGGEMMELTAHQTHHSNPAPIMVH